MEKMINMNRVAATPMFQNLSLIYTDLYKNLIPRTNLIKYLIVW